MLLEETSFDGHELKGRVLIATDEGRRTIRLSAWPFQGMNLERVRRCGSSKPLTRHVRDGGYIGIQLSQLPPITLLPGCWFGRDIDILVASEDEGAVECALLDASIPLDESGQPGSKITFSIRAERNGKVSLMTSK